MPVSDGPFGAAPDIGIGFSDVALLTFSFLGLGFLGFTLYSVVLSRLKTRAELGAEDEGYEKKYEDILAEADVSTLSRAQRRARARQIMKQQRRAFPTVPAAAEAAVHGDEGQAIVAAAVPNNNDDDSSHNHVPILSRKERQRLAKAAEREERRVLEDERREQQKLAQEEAHRRKLERQKLQAQQQEEMKKRQQLERTLAEKAKQDAWETFVRNSTTGARLSMEDWLARCEQNPLVKVSALATEFGLSSTDVRHVIEKAVQDKRVVGVFANEEVFVVFNKPKIDQLLALVMQKGEISASEIAKWMTDQITPTLVHE
jgi:hypothetical protein